MPSIEDVQAKLATAAGTLTMTLTEVLKHFTPNEYMSRHMEEYIHEWSDKPLHDFMIHIHTAGREDVVSDILNGEMKPFNLLWVLSEFYVQPE